MTEPQADPRSDESFFLPAAAATEGTLQLLTPEGQQRHHPEFSPFLEHLNDEDMRGAYRSMALARRYDREATALQRQGQLLLWPPAEGQEGTQIGVHLAASPRDYLVPTYREHALALARGVTPAELLALFRGTDHGAWDPRPLNFHLYTLVLATQTLHAVGYAMGIQRDLVAGRIEEPEAVVVFFGDGASSEGDVHEAMVFAASYQAPVIFLCQNNQWAISVPASVQSKIPLVHRAQGYGMPGVRVDGNDVLASYAATRWALEHAKSGHGPVLLEALTYRLGAHTTADDPTKYRSRAEEESWSARDPLTRLETFLRASKKADQAFFDGVAAETDELATQLRSIAYDTSSLDFRRAFETIYADRHPLVDEELAWHHAWQTQTVPLEAEPTGGEDQ